mmetsp:Transcript_3801/g.9654  ORF Transcript_3801/g.9654 Transcript_3801/m.9654 type:complete len:208 (+) Transcript_3801:1255-1878(+)
MKLENCRICCLRAMNWSTIAFTASMSFPDSSEMRFLMSSDSATMSGSALSSSVIASIISRMFFMLRSASIICLSVILFMPGMSRIVCPKAPIRFIMSSCFTKSSKSNLASIILLWSCFTSSSLKASSAFSTSVSTSPIPRMRDAIRSGRNSSKSPMPSPIEMNLTGFPVMAFMVSAAPPLVSPSILDRSAPVMPTLSSKTLARDAAS